MQHKESHFLPMRKRRGIRAPKSGENYKGETMIITDLNGGTLELSKTKFMGEFLNWVNDRKVICKLNVGVSGTSKSWGAYCIAGEFGLPVIN